MVESNEKNGQYCSEENVSCPSTPELSNKIRSGIIEKHDKASKKYSCASKEHSSISNWVIIFLCVELCF